MSQNILKVTLRIAGTVLAFHSPVIPADHGQAVKESSIVRGAYLPQGFMRLESDGKMIVRMKLHLPYEKLGVALPKESEYRDLGKLTEEPAKAHYMYKDKVEKKLKKYLEGGMPIFSRTVKQTLERRQLDPIKANCPSRRLLEIHVGQKHLSFVVDCEFSGNLFSFYRPVGSPYEKAYLRYAKKRYRGGSCPNGLPVTVSAEGFPLKAINRTQKKAFEVILGHPLPTGHACQVQCSRRKIETIACGQVGQYPSFVLSERKMRMSSSSKTLHRSYDVGAVDPIDKSRQQYVYTVFEDKEKKILRDMQSLIRLSPKGIVLERFLNFSGKKKDQELGIANYYEKGFGNPLLPVTVGYRTDLDRENFPDGRIEAFAEGTYLDPTDETAKAFYGIFLKNRTNDSSITRGVAQFAASTGRRLMLLNNWRERPRQWETIRDSVVGIGTGFSNFQGLNLVNGDGEIWDSLSRFRP